MLTSVFCSPNTKMHSSSSSEQQHTNESQAGHFDTELLRQVIEIDVDCLAHRLRRERGVVVREQMLCDWCRIVFERVVAETLGTGAKSSFLPSAINERIQRILAETFEASLEPKSLPECAVKGRGATAVFIKRLKSSFAIIGQKQPEWGFGVQNNLHEDA